MFSTIQPVRRRANLFAAIVFVFFATSGFANPSADVLDETHPAIQALMVIQEDVTPELMKQPEVLGTAISLDEAGNPALTVYVNQQAANVEQTIRRD
jgi:hypothetical protein